MVYRRVKGIIFSLFFLLSYATIAQATGNLWFNGFGPVKFGDTCKYKTAKYEIHKHHGFTIKAHCFSHRGIQTGIITSISIYTNDLTLESAKRLINQHIKKKDKRTALYWTGDFIPLPGRKGATLWPSFGSPPKTTRVEDKYYTNVDHEIGIYEYSDPNLFQNDLKYGSVEIRIFALKLRCEARIKVEQTIRNNKFKKIEKELNTNSAKSLLDSFN